MTVPKIWSLESRSIPVSFDEVTGAEDAEAVEVEAVDEAETLTADAGAEAVALTSLALGGLVQKRAM